MVIQVAEVVTTTTVFTIVIIESSVTAISG